MLIYAAVLFAIAAIIGAIMVSAHIDGRTPKLSTALLHGLFAVVGVGLLVVSALQSGGGYDLSLILFVVAALGGLVLFSYHLRQRRLPTPVVLIHALVAILAFVLLIFSLTPDMVVEAEHPRGRGGLYLKPWWMSATDMPVPNMWHT